MLMVCFTYSSNFGELVDFIIESQIYDSFPTENLCHRHHSLQCKACHLFHNACMPKRLCVNQIFILGDSSNLFLCLYNGGGESNSMTNLPGRIIYLKNHIVIFFFGVILVH